MAFEKLTLCDGRSLKFRSIATDSRLDGAKVCGELFHNQIGTWLLTDDQGLVRIAPDKLELVVDGIPKLEESN